MGPTRPATTTPGPPAPTAPGGGADEISKLKLTVHVWADKPAERLVFINGRKYVQGDRIEDKVVLEEITQEGAMVSYQGPAPCSVPEYHGGLPAPQAPRARGARRSRAPSTRDSLTP